MCVVVRVMGLPYSGLPYKTPKGIEVTRKNVWNDFYYYVNKKISLPSELTPEKYKYAEPRYIHFLHHFFIREDSGSYVTVKGGQYFFK